MNYITKIEGIRFINKLLHEKIRDFKSYNKIVKEKFKIYTNVPIFIDESIILLPIKRFNSYDCIWINYVEIKTFISSGSKTLIKFNDGSIKAFDVPIKKLERIIQNALIIKEYFKNLSTESVNT
ncbi:MAG: competence protein ComK [Acholeplasmatales bacterium]|nr:competence protein ComK [Acholeplasmatales bacterium]